MIREVCCYNNHSTMQSYLSHVRMYYPISMGSLMAWHVLSTITPHLWTLPFNSTVEAVVALSDAMHNCPERQDTTTCRLNSSVLQCPKMTWRYCTLGGRHATVETRRCYTAKSTWHCWTLQPTCPWQIPMASILTEFPRLYNRDLAHVVAVFLNACVARIIRSRSLAIYAPLTSVDNMQV
jgi:hypothetical protein